MPRGRTRAPFLPGGAPAGYRGPGEDGSGDIAYYPDPPSTGRGEGGR